MTTTLRPAKFILAALAAAAVLAACGGRVNMTEMPLPPQRANQLGYSFLPLNEKGWLLVGRQPRGIALGKRGADPDETYAIQGFTFPLPAYPTPEAFFADVGRARLDDAPPGRFKVVSHESRPAPEIGALCARTHTVSEDHAPTRRSARTDSMILEAYSLICSHPKDARVGVMVTYSQRYYSGSRDPGLQSGADTLLATVKITDF